ncbi:MAG: tetratricopeptide repeat protein [Anaerolineae bacterium]|nr:tetratricopeptide repeat protein [Anaerolineae bacterium]
MSRASSPASQHEVVNGKRILQRRVYSLFPAWFGLFLALGGVIAFAHWQTHRDLARSYAQEGDYLLSIANPLVPGRYELTINAYRRAIALEPGHPRLHEKLGQAYAAYGWPKHARRALWLAARHYWRVGDLEGALRVQEQLHMPGREPGLFCSAHLSAWTLRLWGGGLCSSALEQEAAPQ